MFENSTIPFTILKEKNGDASEKQHNQYEWKKTVSSEKLSYLIENVTLMQEPSETLRMSVTLSHLTPEFRAECNFECSGCYEQPDEETLKCQNCDDESLKHNPKFICVNNKGNIIYDLRIDFHNNLHEFSSNYSYEVVCKLPCVDKSDEYLFTCVEPRLEEALIFKKCYAATAYNETFNLSNTNLYFGIRRLNNCESETRISALLRVISTFQNMDDQVSKVVLQARDGQITAHKSILSQYSDVFRAMFAHDMREKQDGVVEIPDVEIKVIKKVVNYLYTGKLENIRGMIEELFKVAHRYQIQELCRRCEEYYILNAQSNNDNIVEMLQLFDLYGLQELKNSAEKFVHRHEKALVALPRYQTYLCESINVVKAVDTLILADKYNIKDIKTSALDFIKANFKKMVKSVDFLKLFESNPRLMKEVYVYSFEEENI